MSAGVYRLEHASGLVYVGATRRLDLRRKFWLELIAFCADQPHWCRPKGIGLRMFEAVQRTAGDGWEFIVVKRFPEDVDGELLWFAECQHLEEIRVMAGDLCCNGATGHRFRPGYMRAGRRFGFRKSS